MGHLKDGLGKEEVQTGSESNLPSQNAYFTGSMTVLSGLRNSNGEIVSNALGSPSTFGMFVQAGSIATPAGSEVTLVFGTQFSSNAYNIAFGTEGNGASATLPTVSGTKNVSGCEVIGDASTTYAFVAVGPA
jgi:hypothetical protein